MSQDGSKDILFKVGAAAALVVGVAAIGYFIERSNSSNSTPVDANPIAPPPVAPTREQVGLDQSRAAPRTHLEDPDAEQARQLKKFQEELEAMLKTLQKDTPEWCDLAVTTAGTYIRTGKLSQRADFLLKKAFSIHVEKLSTSEIEPFLKLLEMLFALHQEPVPAHKLTPYFMQVATLVGERLVAEKSNQDLQRDSLRFLFLGFSFSYNSASWILGDVLWKLSHLLPQSPKFRGSFLDKYTTGLHQQGKTLEGIKIIESFLSELENNDDSEALALKQRFISRASKLYFYYDKFQESKEKLEMLNLSDNEHITDILEYYQVLSELDLQSELTTLEAQIRQVPVSFIEDHPIARSKYLMAMEISIVKQFIMVNFRVCRATPSRKEGEPESEETAARKLSKFFVVAEFEGTDGTVEIDINEFNFEVSSPPYSGDIPNWTRLIVSIYSDKTKSNLLGVHRQMICKIPQKSVRL